MMSAFWQGVEKATHLLLKFCSTILLPRFPLPFMLYNRTKHSYQLRKTLVTWWRPFSRRRWRRCFWSWWRGRRWWRRWRCNIRSRWGWWRGWGCRSRWWWGRGWCSICLLYSLFYNIWQVRYVGTRKWWGNWWTKLCTVKLNTEKLDESYNTKTMETMLLINLWRACHMRPRVHSVKVMPKIFGMGFKILRRTSVRSTRCRHTEASDQGNSEHGHRFNKVVSRICLTCPSFTAPRPQKNLCPGAIFGVVCYQRRRIVAYSAYIFKALGVTSAWGLCGMHPGMRQLCNCQI